MKIEIFRHGKDHIATKTDYTDITDKGEISHIYIELEIIKNQLIELWEEITEKEKYE